MKTRQRTTTIRYPSVSDTQSPDVYVIVFASTSAERQFILNMLRTVISRIGSGCLSLITKYVRDHYS